MVVGNQLQAEQSKLNMSLVHVNSIELLAASSNLRSRKVTVIKNVPDTILIASINILTSSMSHPTVTAFCHASPKSMAVPRIGQHFVQLQTCSSGADPGGGGMGGPCPPLRD